MVIAIMTGSYAGQCTHLVHRRMVVELTIILLSSAWLFVAVGGFIMSKWALKKHKAYKREFGEAYPRHRKAIIPFIL